MHALRIVAIAAVIASGLAWSPAAAQTDGDDGQQVDVGVDVDVPNTTFNSTSGGALRRRAPGNWIRAALHTNPEITREDPHGEDFLPRLYIAMLEAFFTELNNFIGSIGTLLNLGSLLGGLDDLLGMSDAPDAPVPPRVAMAGLNRCGPRVRRPQTYCT